MDTKNEKVAVGLSGGVDSSVSAFLLKEQGFDVTGVFIQCWDEKADGCKASEDRADAAKVAAKLGISFVSLDFINEYKNEVIDYFYAEYLAGRTPNPDVMCNKEIKFGLFLDWALRKGFDFVATGHYARVLQNEGSFKLLRGIDEGKDQSYFLYLLGQKELERVLFPIGDMLKSDVRRIAFEQGFHNAEKRDSTGICFIGEVDIKEFLQKRIPKHVGNVLDLSGNVIGEHDGSEFYTIGQRHGFKVAKYQGVPLYVLSKNIKCNELVVGRKADCVSDTFSVSDLHWLGVRLEGAFECCVRIRHLGKLHSAKVSGNGNERVVQLKKPIFGVAPGQSAVFYEQDVVLGGGLIESV